MIITGENYYVYIHTNRINGKMYIGITSKEPRIRWNNGSGYIKCSRFYNAIKKYGWDNFEHQIFASRLTKDEACNMERLLIKKLKTQNPSFGYNLDEGGSCAKHSSETIEKIRAANIGKQISEEMKAKIRKARKQQVIDPTIWKKTAMKNRGKKRSEEFRKKIKRAKEKDCKKVECIDTGIVYPSITEASKQTNVSKGNISTVCHGVSHKAGGLRWQFV